MMKDNKEIKKSYNNDDLLLLIPKIIDDGERVVKLDKKIMKNKNIELNEIKEANTIIKINNNSNEMLDSESDKDLENSYSDLIITTTKNEYFPKGIKNLGLNDYMNSLLQCLFNIPKLRNYFIEELRNKTFTKKSTPICYYFAKVMKDLLYSKEKYIIPDKFKKYISKKNILFKDNKAADATDLFRYLIESFLDEIESISDNSEDENEKGNTSGEGISIYKKTLFNEIKKEIKNNYIYSILNVYNIVTYYCPFHKKNEDNITYSIESDSNITFYLENIMENRKRNINSPITIKECFE